MATDETFVRGVRLAAAAMGAAAWLAAPTPVAAQQRVDAGQIVILSDEITKSVTPVVHHTTSAPADAGSAGPASGSDAAVAPEVPGDAPAAGADPRAERAAKAKAEREAKARARAERAARARAERAAKAKAKREAKARARAEKARSRGAGEPAQDSPPAAPAAGQRGRGPS